MKSDLCEIKYLKPSNSGRKSDDGWQLSHKTLQGYWSNNDTDRKKAKLNAKMAIDFWTEEKKEIYQKEMKKALLMY